MPIQDSSIQYTQCVSPWLLEAVDSLAAPLSLCFGDSHSRCLMHWTAQYVCRPREHSWSSGREVWPGSAVTTVASALETSKKFHAAARHLVGDGKTTTDYQAARMLASPTCCFDCDAAGRPIETGTSSSAGQASAASSPPASQWSVPAVSSQSCCSSCGGPTLISCRAASSESLPCEI